MVDSADAPDPTTTASRSRMPRTLRRSADSVQQRYAGSSAEDLWSRLSAMDFINRGMLFAAILLMCFLPFLIILNALLGHDPVVALSRSLGLNAQAADDVGKLFTSSTATSKTVAGLSWVFFILSGIAGAAAIEELYLRAFALESRGFRNMPQRVIWLAILVGLSILAYRVGPHVHNMAGPVVLGLLGLVLFTAFWGFSMWLLTAGRITFHELLPCAVATGVFWLGMEIVFRVIFSGMVIGDSQKYGSIGVVFALMSYLIAIGVVVILGAVTGTVWRLRHLPGYRTGSVASGDPEP